MSVGVTKKCYPPASWCHNCKRKGRDILIEEREEFKRCSQCLLLTYCDKDCQKEHWNSVHKHHCRFLSGRKLPANSKHNPKSCTRCVEERKASIHELRDANSPVTSCHIELVLISMKIQLGTVFEFHGKGRTCGCSQDCVEAACELPFSLGEVSGEYIGEGMDELMAHAIRLACAMEKKKESEAGKMLIGELLSARSVLWSRFLIFGEQEVYLPRELFRPIFDRLEDLEKHFGFANAWWKALKFTVHFIEHLNKLRFWDTIDLRNIDDPRFPTLKKCYQNDQSQISNISLVSQNNLWTNFKMWPTLISGLLALKLPQGVRCNGCEMELSGEDIDPQVLQAVLPLPVIGENGGVVALCSGKSSCFLENYSQHLELKQDEDMFMEEWNLLLARSRICDVCLKFSFSSHRCSECLAAQYCSTECQKKDLKFHRTVCADWAQDEHKRMMSSRQQKKIFKSRLRK